MPFTLAMLGIGRAPLVYRRAGQLSIQPPATIPPLGILPALPGPVATEIALESGDIAVAVTDGFYEWEDGEGGQYGIDRVGGHICRHADDSADDLIRSLYEDVVAHAGHVKQADDMTAMVVKRVH